MANMEDARMSHPYISDTGALVELPEVLSKLATSVYIGGDASISRERVHRGKVTTRETVRPPVLFHRVTPDIMVKLEQATVKLSGKRLQAALDLIRRLKDRFESQPKGKQSVSYETNNLPAAGLELIRELDMAASGIPNWKPTAGQVAFTLQGFVRPAAG